MRHAAILCADVLEGLQALKDESVQCVVTSPPYWGLRDYGTGVWEGGASDCSHVQRTNKHGGASTCRKCGAKRIDNQIGLEATPEEYVAKLVEVFREVRRVLRGDGTVWLNLGDSYSGRENTGGMNSLQQPQSAIAESGWRSVPPGLKPKDLVGIPWRVAFALQADGWWLRSDIIWAKPNPMPESVRDRPTRSHEYVFLLAKSQRYFFDQEAVKESSITGDPRRPYTSEGSKVIDGREDWHSGKRRNGEDFSSRNIRSVWTIATQPYSEAHFATFPPKLAELCIRAGSAEDDAILDPFCGAGTAGVVALRLDRRFVGIELNPEYVEMAKRRIRDDAPLLNQIHEDPGTCLFPGSRV